MEGRGIRIRTNSLYFYSLVVAIIVQMGSLCFVGLDLLFTYGLALGTSIAIVNYNLLKFSSRLALSKGKGISLVLFGYIIRLTIYGGAFLLSYRSGVVGGIATLLGFVSFKIALYYLYGIKSGFKSKKYENIKLNNLDEDRWALEAKTRSSWINRLFTVFHFRTD